MELSWTLKSIPELSGLPPAERRRVWRKASWRAHRHWPVWLGLLALGGLNIVGRALGDSIGHDMIGSMIGAAIGAAIYSQLVIHAARPYLRELVGANHNPEIFS